MYFHEPLRSQSRHEEFMTQAERWHRLSEKTTPDRGPTSGLARLGKHLETWGVRLQAHHGMSKTQDRSAAESYDRAHSAT